MCICGDCGSDEEELANTLGHKSQRGTEEPIVCWTGSQVKKEISQEGD